MKSPGARPGARGWRASGRGATTACTGSSLTGTCSRPRCRSDGRRDVVADVADRPARQQRVAVLAVLARPRWCGRPPRSPRARGTRLASRGQPNQCARSGAPAVVEAAHLLQEHQVGVERPMPRPRLWISRRFARADAAHALVDVVGRHAQRVAGPSVVCGWVRKKTGQLQDRLGVAEGETHRPPAPRQPAPGEVPRAAPAPPACRAARSARNMFGVDDTRRIRWRQAGINS